MHFEFILCDRVINDVDVQIFFFVYSTAYSIDESCFFDIFENFLLYKLSRKRV